MPATLARLLADAHHSHATVESSPALMPVSLDAAMAVQVQTVQALGGKVGGWKVGFGADGKVMAAPMLAGAIVTSGAKWPLVAQGPLIAEVEIALRLKHDLPARPAKPYDRNEIIAATGEVLAGIEFIQSRLAENTAAPFPMWLADRLGNAGYICGAERADFKNLDLGALRCQLWADGKLVHDKVGGHPQGDPLAPVVAWANRQNESLGGMKAGQVITTGSLIVPLLCPAPVRLVAEIAGLGQVTVTVAG